jgi:hypothetical protein
MIVKAMNDFNDLIHNDFTNISHNLKEKGPTYFSESRRAERLSRE